MEGLAGSRERAREFRALFESERAFRAWYDRALPKVFGYAYDRCGGVRSVAEELTQETFVEAVRSRDRFDGRSDPVTWLCAIAGHKLADHWRRLHREERRRLRLVADPLGDDPDEAAWRATEDRALVLEALRSLPAMQQAAMALHYLDDLPVAEVAHRLGRSASAVESLLSRGREAFRRALATAEGGARDA